MPQIPQISGPLTGGKTLTSGNNGSSTPQNGEAFSIDGVNAVQRPAGVTQKGGAGGAENQGVSSGSAGSVGVPAAKDPSMAVETLHDVFSGDLLENAKLNGYTELVGEIDDLTKAIYINPDKLLNEILTQEKDNTVFSGNELFDILRIVCAESGEDTKELVANLLKTLNYAMSRNEIIDAVKSNIKFLAEYFGKNTTLSKNLTALYQKWENGDPAQNFESLKNETAAVMRTIAGSLQSDSRTETLVPLVTHNLSRYNTNEYMMKEAFTQLMSQIPSSSTREALSKAFTEFVSKLLTNSYNNNTTKTAENQVANENFDVSAEKASILAYINALAEGKDKASATENGNIAQNLSAFQGTNDENAEAAEKLPNGSAVYTPPEAGERQSVVQDGTANVRQGVSENGSDNTPAPSENNAEGAYAGADAQRAANFKSAVPISDTRINYLLNNYQSESITAKDALTQLLSLVIPQNDSNAAEALRNIVANTQSTDQMVSFLNDVLRTIPDMPERQTLYNALETVMEDVVRLDSPAENTDVSAEKVAILAYLSKLSGGAQSAEKVLSSIISGESSEIDTEAQNEAYKSNIQLTESRIDYIVSNYESNLTTGRDAIGQLLSLLIPRDNPDAADVMRTVVKGTDNLSDMVDFLNRVLENTPDIPERQSLCDAFENIIGKMAQKQEMPAHNQGGYESETMKALTSFIDRNVNHPAIRGIDNFNASNLLQSMLNAPGVFTPLAHYIIPLQVEDTRAFGELWVDNDNTSSGKAGEEKRYHLFLTFDVEAVGRFEVDAYSTGKELNLSVLYPKSYRYRVSNLTDKITRIAAGVGYNVQNFKTGLLVKPHTLAETFPRINENRKSFDVKA
ncbi:MAG: hypothetical protein NC394_04405 [Bacteroides sp.]|nr:hypothetical protein [Bacteroides sp.]